MTPKKSFFRRYGGLLFGLIVLIVVISVIRNSSEGLHLVSAISEANPWWLLLALIFQIGTYFSNAGMWNATLRRTLTPVPYLRLLKLSIAKLFMDQAAPSGGLAGSLMVMESLAEKSIPRSTALRALFIGLAGYYVAYAVLFSSAVVYLVIFTEISRAVFWIALIFGSLVLIFASAILFLWFGDLHNRLPKWLAHRPSLQPFINAFAETPAHLSKDWKILLEASASAGGIFILDILSIWVILKSLGFDILFGEAFASFMISSVAMTISFVPGGLGVFEGASTAMLASFGTPIEAALAATLILRGMTYWLPMLPGLWVTRKELTGKTPDTEVQNVSSI